MRGFTQIPNDIFENPIRESGAVSKQYARLDLYHLAQFKDSDFEFRGRIIRAKVGQVVRSIKYYSDRWKWSEGKVRRFFKYLERRGEIEWNKNKDLTTITLLNYVKNDRANGRQAVGRQHTNNIDNTVNTINTHKGRDDVDDESINRIWSKWSGNEETPPPLNQTKTIVDALNEHPLEHWIPFLEKRQNIKDAKQLEVGDICFLMKDGKITEVAFISSKSIPDFQTTYTIKKLKKNNTFFAEGVMVGSETLKKKKPNRFLSLIK